MERFLESVKGVGGHPYRVPDMAALVADNFMQIGWREIMIPFALDYRSGAVAWGVVAMYLLVAIQVSSWLRNRIPRRWWRGSSA